MNFTSVRRVGARHMAGFSLVELMISMLLGLLILGAAIAVFSSNRASYQANQGLGRVQENARVAFEMLARDLRAAGSTGCSNAAKPEPTGMTGWWSTFPAQSVFAFDNGAFGQSIAGTDALQVMSAGDVPIGVEAQGSTTLTLRTASHPFDTNDVMVVCDAAKVFVIRATAVAGDTITHAGLPGGYNFFDNVMPSSASVITTTMAANQWFVAPNNRNPNSPNSLWVSRQGAAAEEVAEGIDDLQLTFLERGETTYGDAGTVGNWGNVVAVNVAMVLSAVDPRGTAVTRTVENVVSLRTRNL